MIEIIRCIVLIALLVCVERFIHGYIEETKEYREADKEAKRRVPPGL